MDVLKAPHPMPRIAFATRVSQIHGMTRASANHPRIAPPVISVPRTLHVSIRCPISGRRAKLVMLNEVNTRPAMTGLPPRLCTKSGSMMVAR